MYKTILVDYELYAIEKFNHSFSLYNFTDLAMIFTHIMYTINEIDCAKADEAYAS